MFNIRVRGGTDYWTPCVCVGGMDSFVGGMDRFVGGMDRFPWVRWLGACSGLVWRLSMAL